MAGFRCPAAIHRRRRAARNANARGGGRSGRPCGEGPAARFPGRRRGPVPPESRGNQWTAAVCSTLRSNWRLREPKTLRQFQRRIRVNGRGAPAPPGRSDRRAVPDGPAAPAPRSVRASRRVPLASALPTNPSSFNLITSCPNPPGGHSHQTCQIHRGSPGPIGLADPGRSFRPVPAAQARANREPRSPARQGRSRGEGPPAWV